MNLANRFSLIRVFLTPIFVLSILYYRDDNLFLANLPLIIFLTAITTDAVDGFIARRCNQITRFGAVLDPLADKFLLTAAFVTLTLTRTIPLHLRIPLWMLVLVLTRDVCILTGALVIYMMFEYNEFRPSALGKITSFFQMGTILSVLLRFRFSYIIWTTAAVFTVLSGIDYLFAAGKISERYRNGV